MRLVLLEGEVFDGANCRPAEPPPLRRDDDPSELEAAVRAQKPQEQHEADPLASALQLDDAVSGVRVGERPDVLLPRPGQDEPRVLGVPFGVQDEVEVLRTGRSQIYGHNRSLTACQTAPFTRR